MPQLHKPSATGGRCGPPTASRWPPDAGFCRQKVLLLDSKHVDFPPRPPAGCRTAKRIWGSSSNCHVSRNKARPLHSSAPIWRRCCSIPCPARPIPGSGFLSGRRCQNGSGCSLSSCPGQNRPHLCKQTAPVNHRTAAGNAGPLPAPWPRPFRSGSPRPSRYCPAARSAVGSMLQRCVSLSGSAAGSGPSRRGSSRPASCTAAGLSNPHAQRNKGWLLQSSGPRWRTGCFPVSQRGDGSSAPAR